LKYQIDNTGCYPDLAALGLQLSSIESKSHKKAIYQVNASAGFCAYD